MSSGKVHWVLTVRDDGPPTSPWKLDLPLKISPEHSSARTSAFASEEPGAS